MPAIRSELQKKARSAILQYAFFRWESAVILAGTIVLTALLPHPFSWWPLYGWPLLGLLGLATLLYSSLTDADAKVNVLWELFQERFDPRRIQDQALRQEVEAALEYQRRIEAQTRGQRSDTLRDWLEDTANQLSDWIANIYELALQLDVYRRGELLIQERESVPQEVEEMAARRRLERDPVIRRELDAVLEAKGRQWQALHDLDTHMKQTEVDLEESMTALTKAYDQVELIDAHDVGTGRSDRLEADMRKQVGHLDGLISGIISIVNEISGAIPEGDLSI